MIKRLLICLIISFAPTLVKAQLWSPILSPVGSGTCTNPIATTTATECAIDWSTAGIPGGIPSGSWTQSGSTLNAASSPCNSGSGDCTSTIQAALNSCGTNHYVFLGAGTFLINSTILVPSNCELRGSGADQTILNVHGSTGGAVVIGTSQDILVNVSYTNRKTISSGATANSTSLTLNNTTGITTSSVMMITDVEGGYVTTIGSEGTCSNCGGYNQAAGGPWPNAPNSYVRGQIVQVTNVAGNVVTFSPPLYTNYPNTPIVVAWVPSAKNAGVNALQIFGNNSGYQNMVLLNQAADSWVVGVEVNYTDGNFIEDAWGFHNEIRFNYCSNSFHHGAGGSDSVIFIVYKTSGDLVLSNIVERGHNAIMLNWGAAGNVIAYNYTHGAFDAGSAPSFANWTYDGILMHGAHPQFNLFEGNVSKKYNPDNIWGSSSHNTNFRNWYWGTVKQCAPITNSRATVACGTSQLTFQIPYAEAINALAWYDNFVGDVAGSAAQQTGLSSLGVTNFVGLLNWPTSVTFDHTAVGMAFGYDAHADNGTTAGDNTTVGLTSAVYKVYTNQNSTLNCVVGGTVTTCPASLPNSFFLSSKPSWWPAAVAYPAIGPDVVGGTGPGGHTSLTASNPAQYCYLAIMGGSDGGAGSPLAFNANTCYAAAGPIATFTPTSVNFGQVPAGLTSNPINVTLQNTGTANLVVSTVSLGSAVFSLINNTCGSPATITNTIPGTGFTLTPGASCTFQVVYSPVVANFTNTASVFFSPGASNPDSLSLTGNSTGPAAPNTIMFAGTMTSSGTVKSQ